MLFVSVVLWFYLWPWIPPPPARCALYAAYILVFWYHLCSWELMLLVVYK